MQVKIFLWILVGWTADIFAQTDASSLVWAKESLCPLTFQAKGYSIPDLKGNILTYSQTVFVIEPADTLFELSRIEPDSIEETIVSIKKSDTLPHPYRPIVTEKYNSKQQLQWQEFFYQQDSSRERRIFYYNKKGYITQVQITRQLKLITSINFRYHPKEYRIELIYTNAKNVQIQRESAVYANQYGKITEYIHERLDEDTGKWAYSKQCYSYGMSGRLLEERAYEADDLLSRRTTYEYDKQGEKKHVFQELYLEEQTIANWFDYEYRLDSIKHQKIVKEVACYKKGQDKFDINCSKSQIVYQYDNTDSRLISIREGRKIETIFEAYDAEGNWAKMVEITDGNNPLFGSTWLVRRTFEYAPTNIPKKGTR